MKYPIDRRALLKVTAASLGFGALCRVAPLLAEGPAGRALARSLSGRNGEAPRPFSFVQMSDTHVGFDGAANPNGTRAFERAVEQINGLPERPDLVIFTGDLTHDSESPGEHADRMKRFRDISRRLRVPIVKSVPGEHDAGLDGGALYRDVFGDTSYSFDHKGVHFVALDNVSRGKPTIGEAQLAWLKSDLARFPSTAPIVVFTHRPLFDLRPDWEWFTADGDRATNLLSSFENVTVLYGHIHREHAQQMGSITHHAARSLIFAFPDPASGSPKKAIPFDPGKPFQNLGIRRIHVAKGVARPTSEEIELTLREFSGTVGVQQFSKEGDSL